jgi:hypothetical protein
MFSFTFVVVIVCLSVDFSFSLLENKKVSGEGLFIGKCRVIYFVKHIIKFGFLFVPTETKICFLFLISMHKVFWFT